VKTSEEVEKETVSSLEVNGLSHSFLAKQSAVGWVLERW
jgi:hypothetical protein